MRLRHLLSLLAAALLALPAFAQASLPVDPGETVMTHAGIARVGGAIQPGWTVLRIHDVRDPASTGNVPAGLPAFRAPLFPTLGDGIWTTRDLGQIFGLALTDDADGPDIFVASTALYGLAQRNADGSFQAGQFSPVANDAPGSILIVDGTTGAIALFSDALANSGPSVGQVAYDAEHEQLYATDMEDGLLHRLDADPASGTYGQSLGTFDHGQEALASIGRNECPDDGVEMASTYDGGRALYSSLASGFTPLCRRIWGVGVYDGRVYYGTWREDRGRYTASQTRVNADFDNEVWSIALDPATGAFVNGSAQLEITMPPLVARSNWSMPVSDLSFSHDGRLLIAERSTQDDTYSFRHNAGIWAHNSRVLEYAQSATGWALTQPHAVGRRYDGANSAGGVAWNASVLDRNPDLGLCDSTVVASGDFLNGGDFAPGENFAYGFQMSPASGTDTDNTDNVVNALIVDWDNTFTPGTQYAEKFQLGDVETNRPGCAAPIESCMEIEDITITCLGDDRYEITFELTNTSPFSAPADFIRVFLPGAMTPIEVPLGGLPSGATTTVRFEIETTDPPGTEFCFIVQLVGEDRDGNGHPDWSCEKVPLCVEIPECPDPCIDITGVFTTPQNDGITTVTARFTNNGDGPATFAAVTALTPGTFLGNVSLSPVPVPVGGTGGVTFDTGVIDGAPAGTVLRFRVDLHGDFDPTTGEYAWCCTTVVEITLSEDNTAALAGTAYEDADGDGFAGSDEAPIAGAAVTALVGGTVVAEAVTDDLGRYVLGLDGAFGAVTIRVDAGEGWIPSMPSSGETTVTCTADGCSETLLPFGFVASAVDAEDGPDDALGLTLWPNPARGDASVRVALPTAGDLSVTVHDVLGREVARLAEGPAAEGEHTFAIRGTLPAGTYLVRVTHGADAAVRQLVVIR